MTSTRQMSRPDPTRWLYRTEKGDVGPVSTEKLLAAMEDRKLDLGSMVSKVGSREWQAAGEIHLLRDHFATCEARWTKLALHNESERMERRLGRREATRRGAWVGILVGAIVVLGAGGVLWWRLSQAEALGMRSLSAVTTPSSLPPVSWATVERVPHPGVTPTAVPRLPEHELLDTAGIRVGDSGEPIVNRMVFNESGEVEAIAAADLRRVTEEARVGLVACAQQLAAAQSGFGGTEVAFTVSPGKLTQISVGREVAKSAAFQACVKKALARVNVPKFGGNPRRVTVPLKLR